MKVLLDLCVLTELRHPRGNPVVKAVVNRMSDDDLHLSALILGEVAKGAALLPHGRKKRALDSWLAALESQFADRILPVDHATSRLWGQISARVQQTGLRPSAVDGLLAATAIRHGLHIMTRGTPLFVATGALIFDPWTESARNDEAEGEARIE